MNRPHSKPRPAIAYVRVSTDRQELGPEAQRAAIEGFAAREGLRVVAWHEDRLSGATPIEDRPGLLAALGALRDRGAVALVVAKRDRLARDPGVCALVEAAASRAHARLLAATGSNDDTPEAEAMRGIADVFARLERRMIGQRTRDALRAKRAKGEPVGRAPFGMRWNAGTLEPEPSEQRAINRILALNKRGTSVRQIADTLNAEKISARDGAAWSRTTVHRVIARARPTKKPKRSKPSTNEPAPWLSAEARAAFEAITSS